MTSKKQSSKENDLYWYYLDNLDELDIDVVTSLKAKGLSKFWIKRLLKRKRERII